MRRAACLVVTLVTMSGCSWHLGLGGLGFGGGLAPSGEGHVAAQVQDLAQQVVYLIGDAKLTDRRTSPMRCEDSGEYIMNTYAVPIPKERHDKALTTVRKHFLGLGWTIAEARDGSVSLTRSGKTLTMTSRKNSLALLVRSGCFRKAQTRRRPS